MSLEKLLRRKTRAIAEKNTNNLALACKSLGDYYHEHQQYGKALECYQEEAAAFDRLQNRLETSKAHRMIGEMFMLLEKFDNALKHELIYLNTVVELKNRIEEQRAYATIGRIYLTIAQSSTSKSADELAKARRSAEKHFLRSLLICKSLSDLPKHEVLDMTARLYLNLGITYELKGEYNDAIKHFEKAMSICRHNDFWELLHKCYLDTGLLYFSKLNDTKKALQFLNLSINIAERLSNDRTARLCQTLLAKSEVLISMSDFQGAKQILHKAYKMKTTDESDAETIEMNLRIVAAMSLAENSLITTDSANFIVQKNLFEKLGDGACKLKNFSAAIGYYKKMLAAAEKCGDTETKLIPVYVSLYQTYKDMKEYESALEYMWKEYELCKDEYKEAYSTLMGIAETMDLAEKDFWSIDNVYERAKLIAETNNCRKKIRAAVMKQIALREKHNMTTMADIMKQELKSSIDNGNEQAAGEDEEDDEPDELEDFTSEEQNTPDIGDDIDLDDLSDSGDETVDEKRADLKTSKAAVVGGRSLRQRRCFSVKKNDKGESQLHRACISGNLTQVRRLIEQGHPINVRDHAGWLPLHEAANHGFTDIVELLLENGALINDKGGSKCDGFTPLHDACGNGLLSVVEVLLDRNANATLRNDLGDTPLQTMTKWRQNQILEPHEQCYYERIYERLHGQLDKAGVSIRSTSPEQTRTPKEKRRSTPRKRIVSESSSSDDHAQQNSEDFETVDNILSQEFPRAKSPSDDRYEESSLNYREVMSDLRHGNFQKKIDSISESFKAVEKKKKHSAMLAADEVALDDWLEDDLGQPTTKRRKLLGETKIHSNELNAPPSAGKNKSRLKLSGSSDSSMVVSSTNNAVIASSGDSDEENAFNILMNSNQTVRRKKRMSSFSSRKLSSDSLQQLNLLENGFQVHRQLSPEPFLSAVSSTIPSPPVTNLPPVQSCSIKVQVSDLFLNIPVNMNNLKDLTIEWLADEAAKRYYGKSPHTTKLHEKYIYTRNSMKRVKPILLLTTKDGAIFQNSDPLSAAFAENSAIGSTVQEWIMPPLSQRYMETCAENKTSADPYLKQCIELVASTQALTITDQFLSPKYSRSLFKACHFQSNLTTIDLTNSFIEDDGLKFLSQAIATMNQLIYLNLSGNLITANGIKHLATIFDTQTPETILPEFTTLILSYNPLQNQSLNSLEKFCSHLNQLAVLELASTELTDFQNIDLKFSQLTDLDLSFNNFTVNGIVKCIEKLNACKLKRLNLSFCGDFDTYSVYGSKQFIETLDQMLNAGNCGSLEELHLCNLDLNDTDCWQIIQSIKRSKLLKIFSLRQNCQLTKTTWKLLLDNLTVQNLKLEGCRSLLDNLLESDGHDVGTILQRFGNIFVSFDRDLDIDDRFEKLIRFWTQVTQHTGKIFSNHHKVLLTLNSDYCPTDKWHYYQT